MTTTDYMSSLAEGFSGEVLTSEDRGYDAARTIHNGLIDKRPALIARCLNTADVIGAKGIHVDPDSRRVRAQGAVTIRELDRTTGAFGLATPSGVVSSTGIAGLTLGGGLGWLMGRYGMAVDNLLSAEVVLASGEVATASDHDNPDLFWAIRGGGGNFGVVTSFELQAHHVPSVLSGPILHPLDAAPALLSFYRDFCAELPDELGTQGAFLHAPDGSGAKLCAVAICHCGADSAQADTEVAALRAFTDAAITILIDAFETAPTELCALVIEDFHGAVTRIDPTATAYPHRERGHNLLLISQWTDPRDTDACIAWARSTFEALSPHMADRSYTNYLPADDYDQVRQAYGVNYQRLVELKRRYDPNNFFHLNQNIDPP
jgi:FAD/FMN-containing dehydrogenase